MKNILIILSAEGTSKKAIEFAVEIAKKENTALFAIYILKTSQAADVSDRFSDIGFIGDKPSQQITEAMVKEARQRGYEELGVVQIKAMEEGVSFEPLMEEGDFMEKTLDCVRERKIELVVVTKRKRRAFSRYFSQSLADKLKDYAPCEVKVFEE